nr:hypothetical protein CFP56_09468 [Quercus suber]
MRLPSGGIATGCYGDGSSLYLPTMQCQLSEVRDPILCPGCVCMYENIERSRNSISQQQQGFGGPAPGARQLHVGPASILYDKRARSF